MTKNTISQNLLLLGVPRTVSKVIECLSDGKARTLHEIEREADLRQPEVCLAVEMISAYVVVTEKAREGRGRPQKVIEMTREDYLGYVKSCEEMCKAAYEIRLDAIKVLRDYGKEML